MSKSYDQLLEEISYLLEGKEADDDGKMHELATAAVLHPENKVTSFRDENGHAPHQVFKRLAHENGGLGGDFHKKHIDKGNQAANHIKHYLANHPKLKHYKIHDVAWTSQQGDIEKYTGDKMKSKDQGADLMIKLKHPKTGDTVHVGASMKYARKSAKISLSNNTPNTLESRLGMKPGSLQKHATEHNERIAKITGTSVQARSKEMYKSGDSALKKKIEDSSTEARKRSLSDIKDHLSSLSQEHLKHTLHNYFAPEQAHHTIMVHTASDADHVHISNHRDEVAAKLAAAKHITVHHDGGMNLHFKDHTGRTLGVINAVNKGRPYKSHEFIPRIN